MKTAGQEMMLSLVEFWNKNGVNELLPADLVGSNNWGYAIRHGRVAPVILDAGFSEEVMKDYYY